jgi:hypothetical protein
MKVILMAALLLAPGAAQQRDFLTADEADQVRLVQEPNARLTLYASFAKERVGLINNLLTSKKAGRSMIIHDALEDYTEIIDAIDVVADDALKRKADISEGLKAVAGVQKELLDALKQIETKEPADLSRYEFALKQAIEATEDSLELAQQDLGTRAADVATRQAREEKEREALMTPTELNERQAAAKKEAEKQQQQKRKAPTLRRKGETTDKKK